ncbi:MAG: FkbM family methyltransferase [Kiritimatiellae bacterium]|nr:FkbM family methyltransferase [Kiritimatiellia bacterium]
MKLPMDWYNRHKRWLPAAVRYGIFLARVRGVSEAVLAYHFLQRHGRTRTMIDVGAAHGSTLRVFAGDGWRVWAFEPNPANRTVLERVTAGFPQVTVLPYAVSNERRDGAVFYASTVSAGLGSLTPFGAGHEPAFTVDVRTLGDLFPEPLAPDFLKIDTEGYDLFVLKGVPWERMRPRLILCEYDDHKSVPLGYRMTDMADYLARQGYKVWVSEFDPIPDYSVPPAWRGFRRYGDRPADPDSTGNLFAVEAEAEPALARHLARFERAYRRRLSSSVR